MKRAVLLWETPVLEGNPYRPLEQIMYQRAAKKFCGTMNFRFLEKNMQWEIIPDETHMDVEALLNEKVDAFILVPGGKSRSWMYREKLEASQIPVYELSMTEYQNGEVKKLVEFLLCL